MRRSGRRRCLSVPRPRSPRPAMHQRIASIHSTPSGKKKKKKKKPSRASGRARQGDRSNRPNSTQHRNMQERERTLIATPTVRLSSRGGSVDKMLQVRVLGLLVGTTAARGANGCESRNDGIVSDREGGNWVGMGEPHDGIQLHGGDARGFPGWTTDNGGT